MQIRTRVGLSAALVGLAVANGSAQQNLARYDAPLIVVDQERRFERLLDLDGDGDQDVVGWWWESDDKGWVDIRGQINNGSGALSEVWGQYGVNQYNAIDGLIPHETVAGELSGDALEDFVVGIGDKAVIYRSNGSATPATWFSFQMPAGEAVHSVALGDFDDDGLRDVLIASQSLRVLKNRGANLPFAVGPAYAVGLPTTDLVVGEINGDSTEDVVVCQGSSLRLIPMLLGVPQTETLLTHAIANVAGTVYGDIDGDGDGDLVVFGMPGQYQVLRRTGPSSFAAEQPQAGGPATNLGDVDLDGDLDGACCGGGGGGPDPLNIQPSKFEIAHNDGLGQFATSFGIPSLGAEHLAGVADMDQDGDVDLVAGRVIYFSRGPLTEAPYAASALPQVDERSMGDLDRDGDPDLELSMAGELCNDGAGGFAFKANVVAAAPPGTSFEGPGFAGDFDGDGDADLLVQHLQGPAVLGMRLLANNGGGSFFDAGPAAAAGVDFNLDSLLLNSPLRSVAADADNDGDVDLVTYKVEGPGPYPEEYTCASAIWWNNGAGFFTAGPYYPWDETIRVVADVNGDQLPDLLSISDPDWRLGLRLGTGAGGFSARTLIGGASLLLTPLDPVLLADFDLDGDLDLAAISVGSGTPTVLINAPLQLFTTSSYPAGSGVLDPFAYFNGNGLHLFATDVNLDGYPDLLAGPLADGNNSTLTALKNPGSLLPFGSWGSAVKQVFLPHALADVDGDGDVDALTERVVQNRFYNAPQDGQRLQFGNASAGTAGMRPTLGASGPFRVAESPVLSLSGAPGPTLALLAVGLQPANLPGLVTPDATLYLDPSDPALFLAPIPVDGQGRCQIPVAVDAGLLGLNWYHQAFVLDLGSPYLLTATNALMLRYGAEPH